MKSDSMKMPIMKEGFLQKFQRHAAELGEEMLQHILDEGRKWDISETLRKGGSAIFPHSLLRDCGEQIASVIHGCLDSGADQILVLGVVHILNEELKRARIREKMGEKTQDSPYWGVFQAVEDEYSLYPFEVLWDAEIKRRGIKGPRLIKRYPCLVNREPETLLGIEELERIAKDSVIVLTGDLNHNGVAYNTKEIAGFGEGGEQFARQNILRGFGLLKEGNYSGYVDHCYQVINDARDPCSVLRYLRGPMTPSILDLKIFDTSLNFEGNPEPSWVATSLVSLDLDLK